MSMKWFIRLTALVSGVLIVSLFTPLELDIFQIVTSKLEYQNSKTSSLLQNATTGKCVTLGAGSLEVSRDLIQCKRDFLQNVTSTRIVRTELFNISMEEEMESSISGTPFHPLRNYRSPCWIAATIPSSTPASSCIQTPAQSWKLRCTPSIFIAGFPKSGSSDIFQTLTHHPLILSGKQKELSYWNHRRLGLYKDQVDKPDTYQNYIDDFAEAASGILNRSPADNSNTSSLCDALDPNIYHDGYIVDGTPSYIFSYEHWEKMWGHENLSEPRITLADSIHRVNPDAKIIIVMRNPVDRTYSHYRQRDRYSTVAVFHEVMVRMIDVWEKCLVNHTRRHCLYGSDLYPCNKFYLCGNYLRASMYAHFIKDWMAVFPRKQFLFIKSEDYFQDRTATLRRVIQFLGLPELAEQEYVMVDKEPVRNPRKLRGNAGDVMMEETRYLLRTFFTAHVRELARLLGDDRFLWGFEEM